MLEVFEWTRAGWFRFGLRLISHHNRDLTTEDTEEHGEIAIRSRTSA